VREHKTLALSFYFSSREKDLENSVEELQQPEQIELMKALTIFRMVVISFFLGMLVIFQMNFGEVLFPFTLSTLAATAYLVSIIYLLMIKTVSKYTSFISFQLATDIVIETAIIYYAGGIASPFTFLYMFTIISSAIVLPRPATYIVASISGIIYGVIGLLESYGLINPTVLYIQSRESISNEFAFFLILSHLVAFFLIAYLSDILSQRVKRTFIALLSAKEDLTSLQAFHKNLITFMGNGFLVLDLDERIISSNRAAERILELKENNITQKSLLELFQADFGNSILPLHTEKDDVLHSHATYLTPNDKRKSLALTSSTYKNSTHSVKGYIVTFQDISELKRMKLEVERNERLASVGRIAAGLAHEIRNPLGSISGSIQMLQNGTGNEESNQKLMAITLKETDRLNRIINNLLSLTSQTVTLQKGVNLSEILLESIELFKNDAKYKEIIKVATDFDESIIINGDDEALKQVFWNSLLNSAQSMIDGGEITVTLKMCEGKMDGKEFCELSFSDTGCGIPEADLEKIFEPFYTTKEKGTGLGLSTAHKIIENHSGNIRIKSSKGEGTSFIIQLPTSN